MLPKDKPPGLIVLRAANPLALKTFGIISGVTMPGPIV
jgi:hypothetical protein